MKRSLFTLFFLTLTVVALSAKPKDLNWSQWRGADGTGVATAANLPAAWQPDKNIKWKTPLAGRGHSSPIVWGKRIFLTAEINGEVVPGAKAVAHTLEGQPFKHPDSIGGDRKHTFKVLCLDRDSGKLLWERTAYEGPVYDDRHRKGSYAAPTPATDGKSVFAWFGTEGDGLYSYDFNGKLLWKAPVSKIASVGMGPGASPVLFENLVILQCDEDNGEKSFITAIHAKTGKEAWRVARKVQASWSTPLIVRTPQRAELIASGAEFVIAYDPKTGKELWRTKGHEDTGVPTPVAGQGMAFIVAGYPQKRTMAIKLGGSGDLTNTSNIVWKYEKGSAYVPSPILYHDYLYLLTDRGIMTCLDAKTGKVQYEGGRLPVPATVTASPIAFDDKILLTSEDGDTYVIKAGAKHEVIATNSVGEPVYASPAVADGMIFIRGEKHLFCITAK